MRLSLTKLNTVAALLATSFAVLAVSGCDILGFKRLARPTLYAKPGYIYEIAKPAVVVVYAKDAKTGERRECSLEIWPGVYFVGREKTGADEAIEKAGAAEEKPAPAEVAPEIKPSVGGPGNKLALVPW